MKSALVIEVKLIIRLRYLTDLIIVKVLLIYNILEPSGHAKLIRTTRKIDDIILLVMWPR